MQEGLFGVSHILNLYNRSVNQFSKKLAALVVVFLIALAVFTLQYFGIIWHNDLFSAGYPIKGLDVSHHQGEIDWKKVAETDKHYFVYIKATEGHDFIDDDFATNWKEARENGFKVGAYHFFSIRSSGKEQAEYYIATVPREADSLPPAIDIEISTSQDKEKIRREISDMATTLENYYRRKPIFYVTYETYNAYIKGNFSNYQLWIRDIVMPPRLDREWKIWQFSNRGRVNGIREFVDINVFNGSQDELNKLTEPTAECPLPPFEYMIRSNCPYGSKRIDGECRVVCPIPSKEEATGLCKSDSDCDCSGQQISEESKKWECKCASSQCVLVVGSDGEKIQ